MHLNNLFKYLLNDFTITDIIMLSIKGKNTEIVLKRYNFEFIHISWGIYLFLLLALILCLLFTAPQP